MPDKRFNDFSEGAKRAFLHAHLEAVELNQPEIGPEHVLYGLAAQSDGIAAQALILAGVSFVTIKNYLPKLPGQGAKRKPRSLTEQANRFQRSLQQVTLSENVSQIVDLAQTEAQKLGRHYVGTEHVLLGLLSLKGSNKAFKILRKLGVTRTELRANVHRILNQPYKRGVVYSGYRTRISTSLWWFRNQRKQEKLSRAFKEAEKSLEKFGITGAKTEQAHLLLVRQRSLLAYMIGEPFDAGQFTIDLMVLRRPEAFEIIRGSTPKEWFFYVLQAIWFPLLRETVGVKTERFNQFEMEVQETIELYKTV